MHYYCFIILLFAICFQSCSAQVIDDFEKNNIIDYNNADVQKLTVMQWNVGHFSGGKTPESAITDNNYQSKLDEFINIVCNNEIDIISFSEFSMYFANTQSHPKTETQKLLDNFPIYFIGNNGQIRNYSLNAFFSKKYILSPQTTEYVSNEKADMGFQGRIVAKDYYYIKSYIKINDKKIKFITTHLAFNKTDSSIVINQVKELIDECKNDDYVIILGDFNVNNPDIYKRFCQNGFSLANYGIFGDFFTYPSNKPSKMIDNIIVKGLEINNVRTIQTDFSDHLPILCDIVFSR